MPSKSLTTWLLSLLIALLAFGCAGGGGGGGGLYGIGGGSSGGNLSPKQTFLAADVRHFLKRTHWGLNKAQYDSAISKTLGVYIDEQLNSIGSNTTWETAANSILENPSDPTGLEGLFPSADQLAEYALYKIVNNPSQLQENLGMFFHDHFATGTDKLSNKEKYWMVSYIDMIRSNVVSDLDDFLTNFARNWAVLRYIDGVGSTKWKPNENFAREFWELYSLGEGNGYTEAQIQEASRAFTGYKAQDHPQSANLKIIVFDVNFKDTGNKYLFGDPIYANSTTDDFAEVTAVTLTNREVAEFITKKIFEYYCYDNPSQSLVTELADKLREVNYSLKEFLRVLFKSQIFYSAASKASKISSPVEAAMKFIHATGLKIPVDSLRSHLEKAQHVPTLPPDVNGWVAGDLWADSSGMVARANLFLNCITARTYQSSLGIDAADIISSVSSKTAENVVDHLIWLFQVNLTSTERQACIDYLNSQAGTGGSSTTSTFDATNSTHIDERLRGLLYILSCHPSFHLK